MTQKEITIAKKKAKECLKLFDIKVPMTKMNILYFYIYDRIGDTDCFMLMFKDVRTDDIIQCQYANNRYTVCKHINSTGKILVLRKGENND